MITRLMDKYPVSASAASALIAYVAGAMALTDSAISVWIGRIDSEWLYLVPVACALAVASIGYLRDNGHATTQSP
jgi:predicted tellurium resistance membrane protein TerC